MTVGAPIGVAIGRPIGRLIGSGAVGSWSANFLAGEFPSNITFTRASSATDFTNPALSFGTNVPVLTPNGLLLQGARTNSLRNSGNSGAVVGVIGSGGVLPTRVNIPSTRGLVVEVTSTGTSNGMGFADIRFSGTATSAGGVSLFFEATNAIAAASGQTWTNSIYAALQAGTAPASGFTVSVNGRNGAGAAVESSSNSAPITGTIGRYSSVYPLANVSSVFVTGGLNFSVVNTTSYDFTLRIWERQLEQGVFASSQIFTTTVAVTRAADVATISNLASIGFNPLEGTMVAEWLLVGVSGNQWVYQISDGTANNRIYLSTASGTTSTLGFDGGAGQFSFALNASPTANTVYKSATAFRENDFAAAQNGGSVLTDVSGTVPSVTTINIGNHQATAAPLFGYLRRLVYYPSRLSDAQLQALSAV